MPAKRAPKAPPQSRHNSSSRNTAQAASRKRTRSRTTTTTTTTTGDGAVAVAEAPLRSPSLSVSSGSNSVVAVLPPPVDVDAAAAAAPARSKCTPTATRQTTLPGSPPPAPAVAVAADVAAAVSRKAPRRSSGTAKEKKNTSATDEKDGDSGRCGGEVKPSTARPASARARTAPSLAGSLLREPSAALLLEEALLRHLRHALGMFYMQASERSIKLSVQADTEVAATQETVGAGGTAAPASPVTDNEAERDDVAAVPDAAPAAPSDGSVVMHAVLPCVQYFILHECARVAQRVRSGKGGDFCVDTDPATSAFELLALFLRMMESTSGMAALFVLACPSCRVSGFTEAQTELLAQFLVLSRRVTSEGELLGLDREGMVDRLGLRAESRRMRRRSDALSSTAAVPTEDVMTCCPFGEAHAMLHLLSLSDISMVSRKRTSTLRWHYVPLTAHAFPAIVAGAAEYNSMIETHVWRWTRRVEDASQAAARGPGSARRQPSEDLKPPRPTAALKALLTTPPRGVTWAEALLHTLIPESAAHLSHRDAGELQSRIRRVYAYTSSEAARGGYLTARLPFTPGVPLHRMHPHVVVGQALVHARTLFSLMRVGQHIADAVRRGGRCACRHPTSDPASVTPACFLETHVAHVARLRRCREESYLLLADSAIQGQSAAAALDVDADAHADATLAPSQRGDVGWGAPTSFYSAGSMSRFHATLELTRDMTPGEVVEHAARATVEAAEALPPSQVPRQYIQAELKRHQLENVQWMWSKECEGYGEFVSVPVYHVSLGGAAPPVVRQVAEMWYSAAVNHLYVEAVSSSSNSGGKAIARGPAATRIRGGLLCDDVGLGKTLSVLTLCAYDRAARERGETDADAGAVARHAPVVGERKFWTLARAAAGTLYAELTHRPAVLHWAVGAPTAPVVPHSTAPTPLPRTTLVVVPLSIATQWIEEIGKFYPAASYVLFYGAKRTQYTVADLRRADFVITTYETLSSHLRQEADGVQYWLSGAADAADDATCAAAASQGIAGLLPGDVLEAVQWYAKKTVWPEAAPPTGACGTEVHLMSHSAYVCLAPSLAGELNAMYPLLSGVSPGAVPTDGTWTLARSHDGTRTLVRCPRLVLSVGPDTPQTPETAPGRQQQQQAPRCYAVGAVSDGFLDRVWALLCDFFVRVEMPAMQEYYHFQTRLFDAQDMRRTLAILAYVHDAAIAHCPSVADRRELTRRVLLPPLWHLLDQYWQLMRSHYDAVGAAAAGRPTFRLTDLCFHRIVLDESQKCGPTSLFHLLGGERRWGVTGTVLNNNKTESLGPVLRFLGLYTAARALDLKRGGSAAYSFALSRHHPQSFEAERSACHMPLIIFHGLRSLWWLGQVSKEPSDRFMPMYSCCVCGECLQVAVYGALCAADTRVPCEYRLPPLYCHFSEGYNCTPNMLFEILACTMLRHERNQQVSRELRLPPVQHEVHPVPLSVDEMHLYDRVARVIMSVAARLHRLGAFSSRMGCALQWVQELCRLCLHPSRVGNAELVRGDAEARILRGVRLLPDRDDGGGVTTPDLDAALAATFVAASPQEALRWAQGIAAAAVRSAVPGETAQTLAELAQVPPLLPQCGVCMDDMAAPTLLKCFHMFCKECVLGVIDASRSVSGNVNAKCPYCRDRKSLVEEKRVVEVDAGAAVPIEAGGAAEAAAASPADGEPALEPHSADEEVAAALSRIGDGSRVRAFVELVEQIWRVQPDAGVLVFSKYPACLQLVHDAVVARGYAPQMVSGSSTMAQRQRAMRAMLPSADDPGPQRRRILFVTSRSANAGLNLTFANHVVFVEPNLNPAMEQQAIGRVHRFGQMKQVVVHHLYAPQTIEEVIYRRSVHLRGSETSQSSHSPSHPSRAGAATDGAAAQQRSAQFGRVEPSEVLRLLEYPVPPQ